MTQGSSKNIFAWVFSVGIILSTLLLVSEFLCSIAWAAIIAIATWSLYERWLQLMQKNSILASTSMVTFVTLVIAIPCVFLSYILMQDVHIAALYLIKANKTGIPAPALLKQLPFFSRQAIQFWNETLANPKGISGLISLDLLSQLRSIPLMAFRSVGSLVWHRLFEFGFTMLTLFFFYKDGIKLIEDIHKMGENMIDVHWQRFVNHLPTALRATVNGIILVAIGVGFCMGISYAYLGIPAPALMSTLTALFACVPFLAPVIFLLVAAYLVIVGQVIGAIGLLVWGTLVMFIADHFIRPALIGGSARLPFLSVLFGILGGIRLFGLLGLFLGPMIMVLFITLWHEWCHHQTDSMHYV